MIKIIITLVYLTQVFKRIMQLSIKQGIPSVKLKCNEC